VPCSPEAVSSYLLFLIALLSTVHANGDLQFNNPQATKDAFHEDWFCTGDIGIMRNGKFYIVDRKKVHQPTFLKCLIQ